MSVTQVICCTVTFIVNAELCKYHAVHIYLSAELESNKTGLL